MKYASLMFTGCMLLFTIAGNAQTKKKPVAKKTVTKSKARPASGGFSKTADNLEYKTIVHGKGTTTPQMGDVVEFEINQRIDDSLMYNSKVNNMGKPVSFPIQESVVKGDLMAGIRLMKVGDSTIFRVPLDSLAARSKQPKPEWANKNAYVIWEVKLLNIKTKAEVEAEMRKKQEEAAAHVKEQAAIDDKLIQEYLQQKGITNAKKTASGLYYIITKEGSGPNPKARQKVTVNYTGYNMKGEKFDSNVDTAFHHVEPFKFDLGTRSVIAGWDEGIALLNKGSKATLLIPSGLAYGERSRGPQIPANAILLFDIELLDFQDVVIENNK